jgi:hypothetical protein
MHVSSSGLVQVKVGFGGSAMAVNWPGYSGSTLMGETSLADGLRSGALSGICRPRHDFRASNGLMLFTGQKAVGNPAQHDQTQ